MDLQDRRSTAPDPEVDRRRHVIAPGDTLIGLRNRQMRSGSNQRVLRRVNRIASPRRLVPGCVLRVPVSTICLQPQPVEVLLRRGSPGVLTALTAAQVRPEVQPAAVSAGLLPTIDPCVPANAVESYFIRLTFDSGFVSRLFA